MNSEFYRNGTTGPDRRPVSPQPEYRISLTLSVSDEPALWSAAAARLLDVSGMTMSDVIDVIGPCEDPSIVECITVLTKPVSIAGCTLDDFWVDGLKGCPPRSIYDLVQEESPLAFVEQPARRPVRRGGSPTLYVCGRRINTPEHP